MRSEASPGIAPNPLVAVTVKLGVLQAYLWRLVWYLWMAAFKSGMIVNVGSCRSKSFLKSSLKIPLT